jgi:hypothetical protein
MGNYYGLQIKGEKMNEKRFRVPSPTQAEIKRYHPGSNDGHLGYIIKLLFLFNIGRFAE